MKKTKNRIIVSILAIFTIVVSMFTSISTIEANAKTLKVEIPYSVSGKDDKWAVAIDRLNEDGYDYVIHSYLYLDGVKLRCVKATQPSQDGAEYQASDFQVNGIGKQVEERLGIIGSLGYGYKNDFSDEMDFATSVRVWQELHANYPNEHAGISNIHPDIQAKLDIINERLKIYDTDVSFHMQEIELTGYGKEFAVTLTDNNGVFKHYGNVSIKGIHSERKGNTLTLWAEKGDQLSGSVKYGAFLDADYGTPIFYTSPTNSQDLAYLVGSDPIPVIVKYNVTLGQIDLTKHDAETGNKPQGYGILDYAKVGLYRNDTNEKMGTFEIVNGVSNIIEDLPVAKNGVPMEYRYEEEVMPDGYHLGCFNDKGVLVKEGMLSFNKVEVNNHVKVISDVVKDSVTKVQFHKVDENGDYQPFNHLQLIDVKTYKVIEDWLTSDTYHEVRGLKVGQELILRELREVYGYTRFHDVRFTVNSEQEIQVIEVENKPIEKFEKPEIKTYASGKNGEKEFIPEVDNVVIDEITRTGFDTSLTYTRITEMVFLKTNEVVAHRKEEGIVFDSPDGKDVVSLEIKKDTIKENGAYYFREYYYAENELDKVYAEHDDPSDKGQTIYFKTPEKTVLPNIPKEPKTPVKVIQTGDVTDMERLVTIGGIAILIISGIGIKKLMDKKKEHE